MLQKANSFFEALTGYPPFPWQSDLMRRWIAGDSPNAIDVPTGLGKTMTMAAWLAAKACGANLPRRLFYVVDRRAVVDQATQEAENLASKVTEALKDPKNLTVAILRGGLGARTSRDWLTDPATQAIIVGTVDMIGSRLLFEGYGVSARMRPMHAALVGHDSLIVLDEAHLVPPFEHLLAELPEATGATFKLLTLSATGRGGDNVLSLTDADRDDKVGRQRLTAAKSLRILPPVEKLPAGLADAAWDLSDAGLRKRAIVVFCNSRDQAENVRADLTKRLKATKATDSDQRVGLFTGARRGFERQSAFEMLKTLGFVPGEPSQNEGATFLVATSAAEVGVDLDADDMVGDGVPFERQVQRLGRVNRRGKNKDENTARVWIVPAILKPPKDANALTDVEKLVVAANMANVLLNTLPTLADGGHDVSPLALRVLRETDPEAVAAASSPEPLRPAATRALVDSWSMTSLDKHTGRPEIDPWLRGWVEDEPQTRIVWRTHLPMCATLSDGGTAYSTQGADSFFANALPQAVEELETETFRVLDWLLARAETFSKGSPAGRPPDPRRPVAFALTRLGKVREEWTLERLRMASGKGTNSTKAKDSLRRALSDATLVVDAALGGLSHVGYLDKEAEDAPRTGDGQEDPDIPFVLECVSVDLGSIDTPKGRTRRQPRDAFVTIRNNDGQAIEWLLPKRSRFGDASADDWSRARRDENQTLDDHVAWVVRETDRIAKDLGLSEDDTRLLNLAARLHDNGKADEKWQRAMGAPTDQAFGKIGKPGDVRGTLDGYRHEFGSLVDALRHPDVEALAEHDRDLVLHLIAAHHGYARPLLMATGCERAPEAAFAREVADIALRFARLQRRLGPWKLAWWETLLRSADQRASALFDKEGNDGHG